MTGVDPSPGMIAEARRLAARRERYDVADASALPFADASFDLVTLNNMIPFFDELARVTAPGGAVRLPTRVGARNADLGAARAASARARATGFRTCGLPVGAGVALLARRSYFDAEAFATR